MEKVIAAIAEYGVLVAIAAIFLWDKVTNGKLTSKILLELQESSRVQTKTLEAMSMNTKNTATALEIIQKTQTLQTQVFERHDKRAEYMNGDIKAILENVRKGV